MGGTSEETSPSGVKYFRLCEIEEQKSIKSTWILINYKVYDVTKFLEEVRTIVEGSRGHKLQIISTDGAGIVGKGGICVEKEGSVEEMSLFNIAQG